MRVRVIGAHNLETPRTRHTCFLIDGVVSIDAGSLVTALSFEEQTKLRAVLITHGHFDHCRDLPTLGLATLDHPSLIAVYALPETLASVRAHLMDDLVHPDLTKKLNDAAAKYEFQPVKPLEPFHVLGYQVKAIPVPHPVPALGYIVRSGDGACVAYTGDTSGDVLPFLQDPLAPRVLFVDVTFPNRLEWRAKVSMHLTPGLLGFYLRRALEMGLKLPRIIPVHLGLQYQEELASELSSEGRRLGIELEPGHADMVLG